MFYNNPANYPLGMLSQRSGMMRQGFGLHLIIKWDCGQGDALTQNTRYRGCHEQQQATHDEQEEKR
jgi:hypothetical protein